MREPRLYLLCRKRPGERMAAGVVQHEGLNSLEVPLDVGVNLLAAAHGSGAAHTADPVSLPARAFGHAWERWGPLPTMKVMPQLPMVRH